MTNKIIFDRLEKIIEGCPKGVLIKNHENIKRIQEKIKFFLKEKEFSDENIKILLIAIEKEIFEVPLKEEYKNFKELEKETRRFIKNIHFLKEHNDKILNEEEEEELEKMVSTFIRKEKTLLNLKIECRNMIESFIKEIIKESKE